MKPSCTILTKNKNDSTNELSIKPILLNWSDEPAATIWAAIQVYINRKIEIIITY
jgi:hypothetical protein